MTRDGIPPGELRAVAREQIAAYPSVQFRKDVVTDVTGANGETSVPGVYIAGDAARERYQLMMAAADGFAADAAINYELSQEDWRPSGR